MSGTESRPRLTVFRSIKSIYAQVIDDALGQTLVGVSSLSSAIKAENLRGVAQATKVGQVIAEMCKEKGIEDIVFDKSGNKYHGRVKAVADAARANGLNF